MHKPHRWVTTTLSRQISVLCLGLSILAIAAVPVLAQSIVLNPRPVPKFTIPGRVPGIGYTCFMVIGDQGTGDAGQRRVARLMDAKAQADSLHFILTVGDNFYSDGVTSVDDAQWQTKFEDMYKLPHLQVPFYAALGNHDHHDGNAINQVKYRSPSGRWKMPRSYYTFTKMIDAQSSIQFFALDTDVIKQAGRLAREQVDWLEGALKSSTATWKFVYGHHPVFSYGKHGNERAMIERVRPLLEKYGVDVYVCGHDHDRQLLAPVNGVTYVVSGTGSKSRDTRYGEKTMFAGTNLGFVWFRVSGRDCQVQFLDGKGAPEYVHTWTKGSVARLPYEAVGKVGRFGQGEGGDER